MIELVLVRHAKSDWGDAELPDHDRPLNDRGRRDAPIMARRLAASGVRPARIIASTAVRARTTAAAFSEALGVETELEAQLYGAPPRTLLAVAAASGVPSVLLVAHNPGLSTLAEALSDGVITHLPTCAVARFVWADEDDWEVASSFAPDSWELLTPSDPA